MNIRVFTKSGMVNALPIMAKAAGKPMEEVIEDIVFGTDPHYFANCERCIDSAESRVGGMHSDGQVEISEKVYAYLKQYCEKWRARMDHLVVVSLYFSRYTPQYMALVKQTVK